MATIAFIASLATATPSHAGGEASSAKNMGGGKVKSSTKAQTQKKDAPLLPFLQLPEQKAARAEVETSRLAPDLKEKMLRGDALALAAIEDLGSAGLSADLILKYLRTSGGSYELLTKDIDRLRAAGLTDPVLDYLLTTRARRTSFYYPSLYFSPFLLHDDHHFDENHLGELHHSHTYFGGSHHP